MRASLPRPKLRGMFKEQRVEPRESVALPLQLGDGNAAVTRDISASGMYLEIKGWHPIGGPVVFEMHLADARIKFTAEGEVVRIEHAEGKTGVAVRLLSARLQSLP
jgi:hypothetical protein